MLGNSFVFKGLIGALLTLLPFSAFASGGGDAVSLDLTATLYGIIALIIFVLAYAMVIGEEFLHLRKSKPVIVAPGIIWALVGIAFALLVPSILNLLIPAFMMSFAVPKTALKAMAD